MLIGLGQPLIDKVIGDVIKENMYSRKMQE